MEAEGARNQGHDHDNEVTKRTKKCDGDRKSGDDSDDGGWNNNKRRKMKTYKKKNQTVRFRDGFTMSAQSGFQGTLPHPEE